MGKGGMSLICSEFTPFDLEKRKENDSLSLRGRNGRRKKGEKIAWGRNISHSL